MKTWVEVSKKALLENIKQFKKLVGKDCIFAGIVKSNAYGHGLVEVAEALDSPNKSGNDKRGARNDDVWFGVDSIDEAIILRKNGVKAPILVLGYTLNDRLEDAVKNNLRLIVYNKETVKNLGKITEKLNKKIKIHIKTETGTSRQGVGEGDILSFVNLVKKYHKIEIEGISTHFANIEDTTDHSYAEKQLEKFNAVVRFLENNDINIPIKHTASSAATVLFPETHFDMVRVGISLYGLWSSKETLLSALGRRKINLIPALTWKTKVAQVKKIEKGTPVSYGLTEKVKRDSIIVVLPIGYYDGYDRKLSSIGEVLIRGKRCRVLGRICMNMCVVDVTDVKNVEIEDEVVLLGRDGDEIITAEELASKIGTINYEVVTRINPLIKRVVV